MLIVENKLMIALFILKNYFLVFKSSLLESRFQDLSIVNQTFLVKEQDI